MHPPLSWPRDFLSMNFGIFGNCGIGIRNENFSIEILFIEKKLIEKKVDKISKISRKFFESFHFHFTNLLFEDFFFEKKKLSKKIRDQKILIFFFEKSIWKMKFLKFRKKFKILSKKFRCQILKIHFRHEKLIFFIQIFFSDKVWSYCIGK